MKTNNTINELKKLDKNAFKALNQLYGFNFQIDFYIKKLDGGFTINKVLKESGADPNNDKIAVVMVTNEQYSWRRDKLMAVEIIGTKSNDFNIVHNKRWFDFKTIIDNYYSKGDFDHDRKDTKSCFIITQNKSLLSGEYKEKKPDTSGRLTKKEIDILLSWRYNNAHSEKEFDKSGYYLSAKQFNLHRKARILRQEREKAKFAATNNLETINKLSAMLSGLKQAIVSKLQEATTAEQIKVIEKSLSWYKGLADCFDKFNRIETGEKEKSFSSVESFNNAVIDLTNLIEELKKGVA